VSNGYLSLLKWLTGERHCECNEWTCAQAAKHGHLHVLKW